MQIGETCRLPPELMPYPAEYHAMTTRSIGGDQHFKKTIRIATTALKWRRLLTGLSWIRVAYGAWVIQGLAAFFPQTARLPEYTLSFLNYVSVSFNYQAFPSAVRTCSV